MLYLFPVGTYIILSIYLLFIKTQNTSFGNINNKNTVINSFSDELIRIMRKGNKKISITDLQTIINKYTYSYDW